MNRGSRTYFLANVCHVCKSKNTPYTCEVCKMIFYCSLEHRRMNWMEHSQLCWALKKAIPLDNVLNASTGENITGFKHEVAKKCMGWLGRGLKPWELEIIYHPRVCEVCQEHNWERLRRCEKCEFIYTCEEHNFRKDHFKWCKIFKLYSDILIQESLNWKNSQILLEKKVHLSNGRKSMEAILQNPTSKDCFDVEKALLSELLTYPLTVLNSLKIIKADKKQEITVLFIGAEVQAEVEPLEKWEKYLLHCLDDVNILSLIFLGPELRTNTDEHLLDLCEQCRLKKRSLRCEFVPGKLYHEYGKKSCTDVDIICAMNSGMYRDFGCGSKNSWQSTIQELFTFNTQPVLITEYTRHELQADLKKIKTLCGDITVIFQINMNPYASLKPGLNIIPENETPVIFRNYYYTILRKA